MRTIWIAWLVAGCTIDIEKPAGSDEAEAEATETEEEFSWDAPDTAEAQDSGTDWWSDTGYYDTGYYDSGWYYDTGAWWYDTALWNDSYYVGAYGNWWLDTWYTGSNGYWWYDTGDTWLVGSSDEWWWR